MAGTVFLVMRLMSPVIGNKQVTLMFADFGHRRLVPVTREISKEHWHRDPLKTLVRALVDGPVNNETLPVVPLGTRLLGCWQEGATAWVDFGRGLFLGLADTADAEILAAYGIVNTIINNLPEVKQVQILVEGSPRQTLRGLTRVGQPLEYRADLEQAMDFTQ
jgi:spore germination protein GerM